MGVFRSSYMVFCLFFWPPWLNCAHAGMAWKISPPWQSCPWPLKWMTSQAVEGTWIYTGGLWRFRGKWVESDLFHLEVIRWKKILERVHKPTCSLEKNFSLCMLWKAAEHVWKIMVILNEQHLGVHELYICM